MSARLPLVDALGREVAVVRDGAHAAGEHAAVVDVRGLASGIYFLRLALYRTTFTRPIVVVR